MAKSISRIKRSIDRIGKIQVREWDFINLLNKDIKEVEIAKTLRELGNTEVIKWDFRSLMPAVERIAKHEVDVIGILRKTANYKVIEWDFRKSPSRDLIETPPDSVVSKLMPVAEKRALEARLEDFLRYVAVNLVAEPNHVKITTREISPNVLRVQILLTHKDTATLIGMKGYTAAAIRRILKATAKAHGAQVLLQIMSHQAEMAARR